MGWGDVLCLGMALDHVGDAATRLEWSLLSELAGNDLTLDLAHDDVSAAGGSTLAP